MEDKETVKYLDEVTKAPETGEILQGNGDSEKDELYDQAVGFCSRNSKSFNLSGTEKVQNWL